MGSSSTKSPIACNTMLTDLVQKASPRVLRVGKAAKFAVRYHLPFTRVLDLSISLTLLRLFSFQLFTPVGREPEPKASVPDPQRTLFYLD